MHFMSITAKRILYFSKKKFGSLTFLIFLHYDFIKPGTKLFHSPLELSETSNGFCFFNSASFLRTLVNNIALI